MQHFATVLMEQLTRFYKYKYDHSKNITPFLEIRVQCHILGIENKIGMKPQERGQAQYYDKTKVEEHTFNRDPVKGVGRGLLPNILRRVHFKHGRDFGCPGRGIGHYPEKHSVDFGIDNQARAILDFLSGL